MSLPEEAQAATSQERIAEAVEQEIEVLRRMRPALEARLNRAANILVSHLSSRQARILKVRIGVDRKPRFLVNSASSGGAVYVVNPHTWECSCPDHHRRNAACKHAIAAYVLWKAGKQLKGCSACYSGTVYIGHRVVGPGTGEEREVQQAVPCRRCNGGSSR
jgi:hypothetical protein